MRRSGQSGKQRDFTPDIPFAAERLARCQSKTGGSRRSRRFEQKRKRAPRSGRRGRQGAIYARAADLEPFGNLGRADAVRPQGSHLHRVNGALARLAHSGRLRLADAFHLPLAPQIGFKFSEHAKHVEKALTSRVLVSIGCSVARRLTPLALSARTMSCRSAMLRASLSMRPGARKIQHKGVLNLGLFSDAVPHGERVVDCCLKSVCYANNLRYTLEDRLRKAAAVHKVNFFRS